MTTPTPGARLDALRTTRPLVHNITNYVTADSVANVLLAAGAVPAMAHAPEEAGERSRRAASPAIDIGTPSRERMEGIFAAVESARTSSRPWVLDPVAAGATAHRMGIAERLTALRPTVIRGNAAEIRTLAGGAPTGRGPDAGGRSDGAADAARDLARRTGGVAAVTGATDLRDRRRPRAVGHEQSPAQRVTAIGCGLTAVIADFLAAGDAPLEAPGPQWLFTEMPPNARPSTRRGRAASPSVSTRFARSTPTAARIAAA